jgi:hypothetical protein
VRKAISDRSKKLGKAKVCALLSAPSKASLLASTGGDRLLPALNDIIRDIKTLELIQGCLSAWVNF